MIDYFKNTTTIYVQITLFNELILIFNDLHAAYINRDVLILQWFLWQWSTIRNQNITTETTHNIKSNK